MSIEGWYYLHTNGDLIFKKDYPGVAADIRESDFARMLWPMDPTDRFGAWRILIEASALDANKERIADLVTKWGCNDADADELAKRCGITIELDGNAWCATHAGFINLQESEAGFGENKLEAMADLAKHLGFSASKMWGPTFFDLLKATKDATA